MAVDITQPNFVRSIDVTSAAFDGTDTANVADTNKTQETNGSKFNPWKKNGGFLVKPKLEGLVDVLMWGDYDRNARVVDNDLKQTVFLLKGEWSKERIVKIYTTSVVKTMDIGITL